MILTETKNCMIKTTKRMTVVSKIMKGKRKRMRKIRKKIKMKKIMVSNFRSRCTPEERDFEFMHSLLSWAPMTLFFLLILLPCFQTRNTSQRLYSSTSKPNSAAPSATTPNSTASSGTNSIATDPRTEWTSTHRPRGQTRNSGLLFLQRTHGCHFM